MEKTTVRGIPEILHSIIPGNFGHVILLFSIISLLAGCGESKPARVAVSGKVLIDGEPLSLGNIRFIPKQGRPSSSTILSDGSFDLASTTLGNDPVHKGVIPGDYKIEVSGSEVVDEETVRWHAPKKYSSFRSSGLEQTIEKPTNDLVIELTWDGFDGPVLEGPEGKLETKQGDQKSRSDHETPQEDKSAERSNTDS